MIEHVRKRISERARQSEAPVIVAPPVVLLSILSNCSGDLPGDERVLGKKIS